MKLYLRYKNGTRKEVIWPVISQAICTKLKQDTIDLIQSRKVVRASLEKDLDSRYYTLLLVDSRQNVAEEIGSAAQEGWKLLHAYLPEKRN